MANKVTYKIDRVSNNTLELGLKNSVALLNDSGKLKISKGAYDNSGVAFATDGTDNLRLATKAYVDSAASSAAKSKVSSWFTAGDLINLSNITTDGGATVTGQTIAVTNLTPAPVTWQHPSGTAGGYVIRSITVDKYGRVTSADYKKLSTADLDNRGTYDNYKSWSIKSGTSIGKVISTYGSDDKNTTDDGKYALTLTTTGGVLYTITAGDDSKGPNLDVSLALAAGALAITDSKLDLAIPSGAGAHAEDIYSISTDKYGRVISATEVDSVALVKKYKRYNGTDGLLVPDVSSVESSTNPPDLANNKFLNSSGKWQNIPYADTKLSASVTSSTYDLLGAVSTAATDGNVVGSVNYISGVTYSNTTLSAPNFSGNGTLLKNLDASQISGGTIPNSALPTWATALKVFGTTLGDGSYPAGSVLYVNSSKTLTVATEATSPKATSFVLAKTLKGAGITGSSGVDPAWVDIGTIVSTEVSSALTSALIFKGLLDGSLSANSGNVLTDLPTKDFKVGWMYKVKTAGNYGLSDIHGEVNDTFYCIKDYDTSYASTNETEYWGVVQGNLDNAVLYLASTVPTKLDTYALPIKTTDGKDIFNSGITFKDGVLSGTTEHAKTLTDKHKIWGNDFDGSADITGALTGVTSITPTANSGGDIGASGNAFANVYATKFTGALAGNADTATRLNNSLIIKNISSSSIINFDGSGTGNTTIDLNYANFKVLTSAGKKVIQTATGTGNAISSLTESIDATTGDFKITPVMISALTGITSGIFDIVGTTTQSISYKTGPSTDSAVFYTGTANPSTSSRLNLSGILYAYNLLVHDAASNSMRSVATLGTGALASDSTERSILAPDGTGTDYGFKKSQFSIAASSESVDWASDLKIPTAAAIQSRISSSSSSSSLGVTRTIKITIPSGSATAQSSINLPVDTLIKDVTIVCKNGLTATAPCVSVTVGGTTLVESSENDLSEQGLFEYKLDTFVTTEGHPTVNFTTTSSTTTMSSADSGNMFVLIDYIDKNKLVA